MRCQMAAMLGIDGIISTTMLAVALAALGGVGCHEQCSFGGFGQSPNATNPLGRRLLGREACVVRGEPR